MKTRGLTHVAMAVRPGTLTPTFRSEVLSFYGGVFGWRELEELSSAERLTIAVAPQAYLNMRETDAATDVTYEHFGVLVESDEAVREIWEDVRARGASPDPVDRPVDGHPSFRFRHLLPMAIEVQFFPARSLAPRTPGTDGRHPTP
ncbi:MAG TPA: VOC family protein [Acidimicrobiales bacterium]|nr:VOC family protein [Acidimicrobiales bacterium]